MTLISQKKSWKKRWSSSCAAKQTEKAVSCLYSCTLRPQFAMSLPDAGTNVRFKQTHMSTGGVASPELLPDKVIGDDQVSEQVFSP